MAAFTLRSGVGATVAEPEGRAALFYIFSTIGTAKGVPLSHRNLASQLDTLLEVNLLTEENRAMLPLHYVYPGVIGMLTPLATGLPIKKFMLDFRAGSR